MKNTAATKDAKYQKNNACMQIATVSWFHCNKVNLGLRVKVNSRKSLLHARNHVLVKSLTFINEPFFCLTRNKCAVELFTLLYIKTQVH